MRRRHLLLTAAAAAMPATARAMPAFSTTEVAPGIHVRRGVHEEATPANQDGIANIGFVVGGLAVAVVDPGGSRFDGEALRARIRQVTSLPIRYVVMTHLHPDHVFGAAAFAADRPAYVAHARMAAMLGQRGQFYRANLAAALGRERAGDIVAPTMPVAATAELDLGGRALRLQAHATAHTDNDLSLFDSRTGTLWAGDLLFVDRVPAIDGSIVGWLAELRNLQELPARQAVPGHGPPIVAWPPAAAAEGRDLSPLAPELRASIARGGEIEAAVETVGQSERDRWLLFDGYNGRNVTAAFKELEWE